MTCLPQRLRTGRSSREQLPAPSEAVRHSAAACWGCRRKKSGADGTRMLQIECQAVTARISSSRKWPDWKSE